MVWGSIKNAVGLGEPTLPDGPTQLPQYFPVEPKGCEKHSQALFQCLANEATAKARAMEEAGVNAPYFSEGKVLATDVKNETASASAEHKLGDNPLDECRMLVAYYKRCCDKKLKQKKNWILTEHVRVQEEYRYKPKTDQESS